MLREALLILLGVLIHKAIRFISHWLNGNQVVAVDDSYNDDRSLSQIGSPRATKYDVFLSFRGEDTRQTFASYLYKGLRNAGVHTFMDHELNKGEQISPVLLRTIEETKISMIIFSENYASSTWCMDELVHILECKKKFGRVVIPIFYNVDPSNIRKQKGSFGNGFYILKRRFKDNQEKLQKWRNALIQSTSLSGWHSENTSLKAFKQQEPSEGYMELSNSIVRYCQGNPLALVVLGCFLYGRGKEEWESALEKLNEAPPKDIVNILKLSFNGLDDKQQNVFLDLVFLVKERVCISVNLIRQIYGSSVDIEISVLRDKSLISFNNHTDPIEMHNLVMKMGLEIARRQLFSSDKTPIRLWRHEDIYEFFIRGKGIEAIRCLSLDLSKIRRRTTWRASNFQKMYNLIFLKVHKSDKGNPSESTICDDLNYLPEELRFFTWEEYPFTHVPLHFCSENLVMLRMPRSNIRQLWNGNQVHIIFSPQTVNK